jgi:hypothetical protein
VDWAASIFRVEFQVMVFCVVTLKMEAAKSLEITVSNHDDGNIENFY